MEDGPLHLGRRSASTRRRSITTAELCVTGRQKETGHYKWKTVHYNMEDGLLQLERRSATIRKTVYYTIKPVRDWQPTATRRRSTSTEKMVCYNWEDGPLQLGRRSATNGKTVCYILFSDHHTIFTIFSPAPCLRSLALCATLPMRQATSPTMCARLTAASPSARRQLLQWAW